MAERAARFSLFICNGEGEVETYITVSIWATDNGKGKCCCIPADQMFWKEECKCLKKKISNYSKPVTLSVTILRWKLKIGRDANSVHEIRRNGIIGVLFWDCIERWTLESGGGSICYLRKSSTPRIICFDLSRYSRICPRFWERKMEADRRKMQPWRWQGLTLAVEAKLNEK